MKQKNLVMLGVAVGCGLVAAIAVAKLSAGGSRAPETVKVWVAKKDIPIDTAIDEKNADEFLGLTDLPKGLAPLDPIEGVETIKGKSNNRTLRAGNAITLSDFGNANKIAIPNGLKQVAFTVSEVDGVDGFAKPGSKVDVHYIEKTNSGRTRTAIILRDMLVLAIGKVDRLDDKQPRAIQQVQSVSLGVTDAQATLVAMAEKKGTLKLVLRSAPLTNEERAEAENIKWQDDPLALAADTPVVPAAPAKSDTVVVAKKAVPANTLVNRANVAEYFTTSDVKKTPEGAVAHTDDLLGRFVVKDLTEGTQVYKSVTGDKAAEVAAETTPAPTTAKVEPKPTFPRFEQSFVANGVSRTVIWLEVAPEKWKRFDDEKAAADYRPEPASKADDK